MQSAKQIIARPAPSPSTVIRDWVVSSQFSRVTDSSISPRTVSDGRATKTTIKSQIDCCPLAYTFSKRGRKRKHLFTMREFFDLHALVREWEKEGKFSWHSFQAWFLPGSCLYKNHHVRLLRYIKKYFMRAKYLISNLAVTSIWDTSESGKC